MKRTQVYLTEEQDHRLARIAEERGMSRAAVLRWALDAALVTGDVDSKARDVIVATSGLLADYPDWPEWQRDVRGRTAAERLGGAD